MTSILVVDNYDSFVYNLVQYVGSAVGAPDDGEVIVRRNDAIDVAGIRALDPDGIVVSPGPGTPTDAGVSIPVFRDLAYPTLGVCLGHQALCAAHGAPVGHAPAVVHGKPSTVEHDGRGVFAGLPSSFEAGRYHSLSVECEALPECLVETATARRATLDDDTGADDTGTDGTSTDDTEVGDASADSAPERGAVVMGVRHRDLPHEGVQFHPESILTDVGRAMIATFVEQCRARGE